LLLKFEPALGVPSESATLGEVEGIIGFFQLEET
jgi:hypothetical protein